MMKSYEFSAEGIADISDIDIHTIVNVALGHMGAELMPLEEQESLKNSLINGLRGEGDFDFEEAWIIIKNFVKRYWTLIKRHDVRGAPKEVIDAIKDIPFEAYLCRFENILFGSAENRRLIVEWFHKNSQIPNDEAPTVIKNSKYGRGVFASKDIKKGDLIAYYPMDWVSDSTLCPKNEKPFTDGEIKWICLQNAGVLGYGNPYDKQGNPQRILDELYEAEGRITPRINDYGFSFASDDGAVHIWGDPLCEQPNSWFRGCLINDGAYHPKQTEEGYMKEFEKMGYSKLLSKCNTRLATRMIASRDIKKGEEILTYYGEEYWFGKGQVRDGKGNCDHNCRHHVVNLTSKGQKKKAKDKKKRQQLVQNATFKELREGLLQRAQNEIEGFEGHKFQIVITDCSLREGGGMSAECCPILIDSWVAGDPLQMRNFYPTLLNQMSNHPAYNEIKEDIRRQLIEQHKIKEGEVPMPDEEQLEGLVNMLISQGAVAPPTN